MDDVPAPKRAKGYVPRVSTFQQFANGPGEDTSVVSVATDDQERAEPLVLAVFDGHNGHEVAAFCAAHLVDVLRENGWDLAKAVAELESQLERRQAVLRAEGSTVLAYNLSVQGCTAAIALFDKGVLKVSLHE